LQPLVAALGNSTIEMWVGRVRRAYEAHLELSGSHLALRAPSSIILRLCKLVQALPPKERRLWNAAKTKSLDIGIEAPKRNRHYWSAVSPDAVRAAAEVGAQIAITIYGPMEVAKPKKKRAAPAK